MVKNATKIRQRPVVGWLVLAIVFFLLSLRAVNPYDIWYLLLAGEKFLQTGAVPQQEFFLYPGHGQPQLFGGWGYGVLAELARRAGGLIGLSLFNAALWTICLLLAVIAIRLRAGRHLSKPFVSLELATLLLTLVVVYPLLLDRTAFRPEVTAYILWFGAYAVLEIGRQRQNFSLAWLTVPLLAWLEAWLHTAAAIFLPLLAAFMAEATLMRNNLPVAARLRIALPWCGAMIATILLPSLNPNGANQVYANLAALLPATWADMLPHGTVFQQTPLYNLEYLPFWQLPHLYPLYAQATGLLLILLYFDRCRLHLVLSIAPFAFYALLHARGLALWGAALLVPFGALLQVWSQRLLSRRGESRESYAIPVGLLMGLLIGIVIQNGGWSWPRLRQPHAELMQVIKTAVPDGGNIFTEYHLGAVTAWSLGERYRVALSAHMVLPNPAAEQHYTRIMQLQPGWREELQNNGVSAVVVDILALYGGQLSPLARHLVYDPGWHLVTVSGATAVFVRDRGQGVSADDHVMALRHYWRVIADFPATSATDRTLARQRLAQLEYSGAGTQLWQDAQNLEVLPPP